jgi:hypothetical protein
VYKYANQRSQKRSQLELTALFFVVRYEQGRAETCCSTCGKMCMHGASLSAQAEDNPGKQWKPSEAAQVSRQQRPDFQEADGCMTRTAVQEQHIQMFAGQHTADCMNLSQILFVISHLLVTVQSKRLLNDRTLSVWVREVVCV